MTRLQPKEVTTAPGGSGLEVRQFSRIQVVQRKGRIRRQVPRLITTTGPADQNCCSAIVLDQHREARAVIGPWRASWQFERYRRRADRLLVRKKHCRTSLLSKINCGVIFHGGLSNTMLPDEPSSGAPPLTRTCGGHTVEPSFAHREHGSWFVIWHFLDGREQR
jgi:hypothetical protein